MDNCFTGMKYEKSTCSYILHCNMQNRLCHTLYLVSPLVVSVHQMHNSTFGWDENEWVAIDMLLVRTRQTAAVVMSKILLAQLYLMASC